jgi:hypothetical protein
VLGVNLYIKCHIEMSQRVRYKGTETTQKAACSVVVLTTNNKAASRDEMEARTKQSIDYRGNEQQQRVQSCYRRTTTLFDSGQQLSKHTS